MGPRARITVISLRRLSLRRHSPRTLLRTILLPACLTCAACASPAGPCVDVQPDVESWRLRTPNDASVYAYAAALEGCNPGRSASFDPSDGITREEGEAIALVFHPDLRVARLEARVPRLGARQSGVPEDPRIEIDVLRILESVASPWILGTGIAFSLPLSGRLGAERAEAFAEADAALYDALVAEAEHLRRLGEAWNAWTASGERIALLEDQAGEVREVLRVATVLRDAGRIGATQIGLIELESATRAGELYGLRLQREREALEIKALLGLAPFADVLLVPGFTPDAVEVPFEVEEASLRSANLELARAKAEFVRADRTLRHEAAKRFPDLEIGPLFESEEGVERLGAGVGIALPLWNRNRRAIAEAWGARAAKRAAYQARYEDLVSRLAAARADAQAAIQRTDWLRDRVAPLADRQLENVRRAGELGDVDVVLLKDSLSSALETKTQLLEARWERARAAERRRALVAPLRTPVDCGTR